MGDPVSLTVPLTAVAARHSMSKRHVERIVKDDLGMSFVQWRRRRRLNLALRRIRVGPIAASAARAVGYRGSDGLIRAAGRLTQLARPELAGDLAGAVRGSRRRWPEPTNSNETADHRRQRIGALPLWGANITHRKAADRSHHTQFEQPLSQNADRCESDSVDEQVSVYISHIFRTHPVARRTRPLKPWLRSQRKDSDARFFFAGASGASGGRPGPAQSTRDIDPR